MKHETTMSRSEQGTEALKPAEVISVARILLEHTVNYVEAITEPESLYGAVAHDSLISECVKRFHVLAAPQLAEWVIDRRLFPAGEATEPRQMLEAIDTELGSWQRYGIVESQVEPLRDFVFALLDTQYELAEDDNAGEAIRRQLVRGIELAETRLAE